ncbi:MAG: hypothetical protein KDC46_15850 [Thermoleophilia bacterium]|nr:hypothetical protein [Thermoleophilia bacterium]
MHDGWVSVLATYLTVVGVLVVWFWMILRKLARSRAALLQARSGEGSQAS